MFNSIKYLVGFIMILSSITGSSYATTGEELQKKADVLREEGKSLEAIDIYNRAIVLYQQENDYQKILGALTGRLLSWKHLFYKTKDKIYAIFVQKDAEAMLQIANEYSVKDKLSLIHYLYGTSALLFNDYASAEKEFIQAIDLYPADNAEKGDWMAHLGEVMYRNGKKQEGKQMILKGIQRIKDHSGEIDSFLFNVWVSGAYLRLANILKDDDRPESLSYLKQAQEIIDHDDRLVIRKQQLEAYLKLSR